MRVLVIGGGAREHALLATLAAAGDTGELVCVPGNPGIARIARTHNIGAGDLDRLVTLAADASIDFTIVGPELPLSSGIVDRFQAAGLGIFGPSRAAARLESSKAFAKTLMARCGVPTARFVTCASADDARTVIDSGEFGWPVVLKADGLAAGKGVVIADDRESATAAIRASMQEHRFGDAGARLVIEACLRGQEVSFFAVCDGVRAVPIGTAHDHKRIFDGDRGPNTGGMGAFAPSPLVDGALETRIMDEIVQPVLEGMAAEGSPFRGFLYAGLMLTDAGPQVIEFNVRLGDPEAQVILPLLDEPLLPLLRAAATGGLEQSSVRTRRDCCAGVVLASRGYPDSAESDRPIAGIERAESISGVVVYHAGTSLRDGRLVTAGGRVLTVTGRGGDLAEAIDRAYAGVREISFDGMQYRSDIGAKLRA